VVAMVIDSNRNRYCDCYCVFHFSPREYTAMKHIVILGLFHILFFPLKIAHKALVAVEIEYEQSQQNHYVINALSENEYKGVKK
jgi:hypothetical protein